MKAQVEQLQVIWHMSSELQLRFYQAYYISTTYPDWNVEQIKDCYKDYQRQQFLEEDIALLYWQSKYVFPGIVPSFILNI